MLHGRLGRWLLLGSSVVVTIALLDGHLTASGHALYARLIGQEIARRGLLGG